MDKYLQVAGAPSNEPPSGGLESLANRLTCWLTQGAVQSVGGFPVNLITAVIAALITVKIL
ncbi:hypothetical protein [Streptomyces sp. NPDC094049]|uniref:hypothetical protein n=1 Tax=Streptomyces sp. NPDC094049 TaxID=3154987 RepID=UPI0033190E19